MGVRAHSGGAAAIASGQLTGFFGAPIALVLEDWGFTLSFRFERDEGEVRMDAESDDEHMELVVYNFEEGRGTAQPIAMARRDPVGLWLHFRVFRHGNTLDHTVHYTIWARLLEEEGESAG